MENLKLSIENEINKGVDKISVIDFVDLLIEYAYVVRASDVHLEPMSDRVVARFRVDGILIDSFFFSKELQAEVVSRIKVLSDLKIDIHHIPQDGRFKSKVEDSAEVDVRVSIAPTYYGENVVMRVLAETTQFTLVELGFTPEQIDIIEKAVKKPYGMILANGPTGSGKSTTLYTLLKKLNVRERSIITIEDPIEYSVSGITQMPVNVQAGLNFGNGLRAILRQDPDIIMVGEIRDKETAGIAVNAALTGHLMFSTLHTNDAATTFPRLVDMDIEPFLIASTLNVVIGQRLVRKVCDGCRKEHTLDDSEKNALTMVLRENLGHDPSYEIKNEKTYTVGDGCDKCNKTGYTGRTGIHEVLEVNDEIRKLIIANADASQIKQMAMTKGMQTMLEDGLQKAFQGVTTVEEVLRITYE
ncbi:MAG: GspE/PulE family protein [Candidatus Paceibacterota bacterium]|jgi:type II secretory ATPase GspE/PulE/Tfp pilus assembly ATPase PilB-like protein